MLNGLAYFAMDESVVGVQAMGKANPHVVEMDLKGTAVGPSEAGPWPASALRRPGAMSCSPGGREVAQRVGAARLQRWWAGRGRDAHRGAQDRDLADRLQADLHRHGAEKVPLRAYEKDTKVDHFGVCDSDTC